MPYKLKCSTKSRKSEEVSYEYSLNNDSENSFRLVLNDAFSCVIDCFVLNDTKLVNTFDMNYHAVDWLIIKRDYVDIEKSKNDNYQSILKFYIQDNYTKVERYAYLTLTDNLTGDTTFLTIEQPACIYKIEVNDKDEDFNLSLPKSTLQYKELNLRTEDVEVKVYGGHEKLRLYSESLTKIKENIEVPIEDELEREIGFKIKEIGLNQQLYEDPLTKIKDKNVTIIENGIMTRYSRYIVTVTFNGSLIDEGHKVIGYLRHYDDNDTVRKLIYEATVPLKKPTVKLPEIKCINRQKKNKKNRLDSKPLPINNDLIKKSRKKSIDIKLPVFNPIEEKYIKGTEIGIVTTNKKGEHDSLIVTESYAPLWCHVNTEYDYDNECHIINVKCDNNFYGKTRKTRLLIKNAEVMGSIISYSVLQDTKNNITIERYQ